MTCNILMFPAYDRMMQVHQDRRDQREGTGLWGDYFVITAGKIQRGKQPSATVVDLNLEREKWNS